jgi:hypothetical protein
MPISNSKVCVEQPNADQLKADVNVQQGDVDVDSANPLITRQGDGFNVQGAPGFTGFNTFKVAQETQIFEEGFSTGLDTTEVWNLTETGTGTVTTTDSQGVFACPAIGDVAMIETKLPQQFFHGFSTLWRIRPYTSTLGTLFECVIRRKGVDTKTTLTGYDNNTNGFAIQYLDGNLVRFYFTQGGLPNALVHQAGSGADNLIAIPNLRSRIRMERTVSNTIFEWGNYDDDNGYFYRLTAASGVEEMKIYGLAVIREGAPFQFNASGELIVTSGIPSTPPGSTKVLRPSGDPLVTLSPNQVLDDFFTITNGTTLTVQQLRARVESAGTGKSVRAELFYDPNGTNPTAGSQPGDWERIDTLMGNNFNADAPQDRVFTGDGTARIVLRRKQIGSATIAVDAQWQGFES